MSESDIRAKVISEIYREIRYIPCWHQSDDPLGGEFDLDGMSHRRFVLQTIDNYRNRKASE